jgi:hypothetical protein
MGLIVAISFFLIIEIALAAMANIRDELALKQADPLLVAFALLDRSTANRTGPLEILTGAMVVVPELSNVGLIFFVVD